MRGWRLGRGVGAVGVVVAFGVVCLGARWLPIAMMLLMAGLLVWWRADRVTFVRLVHEVEDRFNCRILDGMDAWRPARLHEGMALHIQPDRMILIQVDALDRLWVFTPGKGGDQG